MRIGDVTNTSELADLMTAPGEKLVEFMRALEGDVTVLGAGGKVGPELVETMVRADRQAGAERTIHAVDLFPDPDSAVPERFRELGASVLRGDLTDRGFLGSLPETPHLVYMVGFKFGTSTDWRRAFHLNSVLPYLVGQRYGASSIVVFSSTNPYPEASPEGGGCRESDQLRPDGIYGWTIVARESSFATTQLQLPRQRVSFYRLAYSQHLCYGVLVDLARMVQAGEPISLAVPAVNLISQRDAIDVAIRALGLCANPALVLNVAGPITRTRYIVGRMGEIMGREPKLVGKEGETCLLSNDQRCRDALGPYRDGPDEMIDAAARWVAGGGQYWDKPTMFGRADHRY